MKSVSIVLYKPSVPQCCLSDTPFILPASIFYVHGDPEAKTAAQLSINFTDIKLEPQTDQNSQWAMLCGGGAYRADATFLQVWINERDPEILHEMSQSSVNLFSTHMG